MFINILFIILLYIFTLIILIFWNIFYLMPWEFSWFIASSQALLFFIWWIFVLWFYLLFALFRWIYIKKLHKNYLFAYLWFIIFLLVFYFGYYTQYDLWPNIPEREFETKLQKTEVNDKENWLIELWKLLEDKNKSILTYSDNDLYNSYDCILTKNWNHCEVVKLDDILETYKNNYDKINSFDNDMIKVVNHKYFKQNINEDFIDLQWLSELTRISLFTSIYELKNWNTKNSIETLLIYKNLWDKLLEWDNSLNWMIVWITIQSISIDNINYILDNYNIKNEYIEPLKNEFITSFDSKSIFSNAIKMEYNLNKYWLENMLVKWKIRKCMIFDFDEYLSQQRNVWQNVINWEKPFYDIENINYFKRTYIYRLLWSFSNFSTNWYIQDIQNLNNQRNLILEKIKIKLSN